MEEQEVQSSLSGITEIEKFVSKQISGSYLFWTSFQF